MYFLNSPRKRDEVALKFFVNDLNELIKQLEEHFKIEITDDNLRNAIRAVINDLFEIRSSKIWKECTTAVASDSTYFQAADQNLISCWHARYRKKGVMVYWHVDTNSVCIYSQLKTCSSSEVASMIEGVLRHCTKMHVEKNYVDTHGASEVGFAFSYILNFDLLHFFVGKELSIIMPLKKMNLIMIY